MDNYQPCAADQLDKYVSTTRSRTCQSAVNGALQNCNPVDSQESEDNTVLQPEDCIHGMIKIVINMKLLDLK